MDLQMYGNTPKKGGNQPITFDKGKESMRWSTKRVNELIDAMDKGYDIPLNPFWDGKSEWKASGILFDYTQDEVDEMRRCAEDVIYFANKYCFVMTDEGVRNIKLRDYQIDILRAYQANNKVVFVAPRQIGKCFLFHNLLIIKDKNNVNQLISLGEFYYQKLKNKRKLKTIEKIKLIFWKTYTVLSQCEDTSVACIRGRF